jgi:hypothetical protein
MSIAFIACVESGNLENQALLLFRSIRKYAGRFKESPIYSFQPRKGPPLNKNTIKAFEELRIEHNTELLNSDYAYYPIGNKIFASARAEEIIKEKILVFIDTDTVILNEPVGLDISPDIAVAVRPVDNKNYGSTGPGDRNDAYWQKLYSICGINQGRYITATIDKRRIRAFWNSGLIAVNRSEGIFQQWKDNFIKIMKAGHIPIDRSTGKECLTFMDQLALAPTLTNVYDKVDILDYRYNYPLPKRPLMVSPYRNAALEDLIHVHYHRWFNKPDFLYLLRPKLNKDSEVFRWISGYLPFEPVINEPLRF